MLEPEDRLLLLDALRPPPGYSFDRAVGTTFTLDLVALLITPVAFALFDVEAEDGRIAANPIAVLESVRRFASKITVFTQAGLIRVPPAFRIAYAYLERSVVAVKAPKPGGIFHPKVWVIRFIAPDGDVRLVRVTKRECQDCAGSGRETRVTDPVEQAGEVGNSGGAGRNHRPSLTKIDSVDQIQTPAGITAFFGTTTMPSRMK